MYNAANICKVHLVDPDMQFGSARHSASFSWQISDSLLSYKCSYASLVCSGRSYGRSTRLLSPHSSFVLQYFLYLNGVILDITDVMVNCEAWSFIATHCPAPRCSEGMTFKGNFLPVNEECFTAYSQPGETYFSHPHSRSTTMPRNNKRKGRRRR